MELYSDSNGIDRLNHLSARSKSKRAHSQVSFYEKFIHET